MYKEDLALNVQQYLMRYKIKSNQTVTPFMTVLTLYSEYSRCILQPTIEL